MNLVEKISVKEIIKDLNLEVIYMPQDKEHYVYSAELNRPGLQFAG